MSIRFKSGGRVYHLHSFTGRVAQASKHMETQVYGSGGGGYSYQGTGSTAPVNISSTTVVHDQVFLVNETGKEVALQLSNFNLAVREGHILTALWIIKEGKDSGYYAIIYNRTTEERSIKDSALWSCFLMEKSKAIGRATLIFGAIGVLFGFAGLFIGAAIGASLTTLWVNLPGAGIRNKRAQNEFLAALRFPEGKDVELTRTVF